MSSTFCCMWLTLLKILRDTLTFAKHVLSAFRNTDEAVSWAHLLFWNKFYSLREVSFLERFSFCTFFSCFNSFEEEKTWRTVPWPPGSILIEGRCPQVGAGWSWAGPELRGRAFHNPLSMATGHNLLSRQTDRSSGLWLSEHLLYLFASISHLLPTQTFHVADLSRPQLEESRAAGRNGPVTTAAHRRRHGRPGWPGAVFKVQGAVQFNITDFILHFLPSKCPQEATVFSMAKSNKLWISVCLCGKTHLPAW